jgi:hypothetical protein
MQAGVAESPAKVSPRRLGKLRLIDLTCSFDFIGLLDDATSTIYSALLVE